MKNKLKDISISERVIALVLIFLFFPLLILLSLISLIDTKQNPIFIQDRGLTLDKYRFKLIKFRTIRVTRNNKTNITSSSILKKETLL